MRFRATIENVSTFTRIMQSIERLSKKCTIRFSEESVRIICNTESEGGVVIWSQIKVPTLFQIIESQSNSNNEIAVILATAPLLHVLKSAAQSLNNNSNSGESQVTVKLTKKNEHACLSFEISLQSATSGKGSKANGGKGTPAVKISHDVKIAVMKVAEAEQLKEPLCPEPDVHIILPPLQKLRTIVERLRSMSDVVGVSANGNGQLQLSVQTQRIRVDTSWNNLTNPNVNPSLELGSQPQSWEENASEDDEETRQKMHSVLISVRSLVKFLSAHVISTTTIACEPPHSLKNFQ